MVIVEGGKGAFTLGVRDSRVESCNTMLAILGLKPSCHENFMLSFNQEREASAQTPLSALFLNKRKR